MLSIKLFEAGLKTMTQPEIRHVVDTVNEFLEEKTVVMTGRVVIGPDGKVQATNFSTKDKSGRPKWGDNYTCLAYDLAAMGIEKWDQEKKPYTKTNYFHQLNDAKETETYKLRQELEQLRDYKKIMEKKND